MFVAHRGPQARFLGAAAPAQKAVAQTEAEFVMEKIEARHWAVVSGVTGKPVDYHQAWLDSQG